MFDLLFIQKLLITYVNYLVGPLFRIHCAACCMFDLFIHKLLTYVSYHIVKKKNVCILSSSATAGSARGCAGTSQGFIFSVWETYHWAIGTRNISHNIAHDLSTVFIYSFKNYGFSKFKPNYVNTGKFLSVENFLCGNQNN
jgi:hypothetical protein